MRTTERTSEKIGADDDMMPAPEESRGRKQLAGLAYEEQVAAVKPPTGDADVKQTSGGSIFEGIAAFQAAMAGETYIRYGFSDTEAVIALQNGLNAMGFNVGPADGIWGPMTQQGLLQFQVSNELSADGIIGPKTMGALYQAAEGLDVGDKPGGETVGTKPGKAQPPATTKPAQPADKDKPSKQKEPPEQKAEPPEKKEEPPLPDKDKPTTDKPTENKPTKTVSGAALADIFGQLQNPELSPKQLAQLHSELEQALGVPQLGQAQQEVKKVAQGQTEGDPRAKTLQFLQALLAWYGINRPTMQLSEKEAVAIQLRLENLVDFYQRLVSGEYEQPVSGVRAAIVSTALSRIGEVESHTADAEAKYGKTRYGWEFLDQVFETSYGGRPGHLDENDNWIKTADPSDRDKNSKYNKNRQLSVKYHTFQGKPVKLESWCSHYAMWVLKSNGVSPGDWPNVDLTSIATNHTSKSSYKPRPGDIAYSQDHNQHYAIVVRVDGNMIHTIDGNTNGGVNSTAGGKILPVGRYRGWWSNFYELNQ